MQLFQHVLPPCAGRAFFVLIIYGGDAVVTTTINGGDAVVTTTINGGDAVVTTTINGETPSLPPDGGTPSLHQQNQSWKPESH